MYSEDGAVIEVRPGGRRRIDRVLAPGFLDGIGERPITELRTLRDDAAQEETDLSFLRRLLHARIDLVRAEQHRREHGSESTIVDRLAEILADNAVGPAAGSGRLQTVEPSRAEAHRRHVEAMLSDVDLSDPSALSDQTLTEALDVYRAEESSVSHRRRQVQAVMDALNAEIAARYRAGTASVDDLLDRERFDPDPAGTGSPDSTGPGGGEDPT